MSNEIKATTEAVKAAIPPEARCQLPTPHPAHRHRISWGDLAGGYWCGGRWCDECGKTADHDTERHLAWDAEDEANMRDAD